MVVMVLVVAAAAAAAVVVAASVPLKVRHTPTVFNGFTSQNNGNPEKMFVMSYAAHHSSFNLNVRTR
jgi:organic hydroperoxide reductase OsmC/OhrA